MVKTDSAGHGEDPGNPWFTASGNTAAQNGLVYATSDTGISGAALVRGFMTRPLHGVGMVQPELPVVGFSRYRESKSGFQTGVSVDVNQGLNLPPEVFTFTFPIAWPEDGKTVDLYSYDGLESPDPLSPCAGYSVRSGLPIYFFREYVASQPAVSITIKEGASDIEFCWYDGFTYTNPDPNAQILVRQILANRNAIVIMPRSPLTPGAQYSVSVTINGQPKAWSFRAAG